jgi:hypothetical protein
MKSIFEDLICRCFGLSIMEYHIFRNILAADSIDILCAIKTILSIKRGLG